MATAIPSSDIEIAAQRALQFDVFTKDARGKPWTAHTRGLSLGDAIGEAQRLSGTVYEVGVLVRGKIYWTTRDPDLFNSTVLQSGYT